MLLYHCYKDKSLVPTREKMLNTRMADSKLWEEG